MTLLRKKDMENLIKAYFRNNPDDKAAKDLITLMEDLQGYELDTVISTLEEKRHWSAAEIVKGGWK